MQAYTEEQKVALIEHAKVWIADAEAARDEIPFGFDEDTEKEFSLIKIALASLTAEPVAYEVKGLLCHTLEEAEIYVGEPEPLYAAPPAPAIRLHDFEEDESAFRDGLNALIDCLEDCGDAEQGLRLALRAMMANARLNATAPQPVKLPVAFTPFISVVSPSPISAMRQDHMGNWLNKARVIALLREHGVQVEE